MDFENYLKNQKFTPSTIEKYLAWEKSFEKWLNRRSLESLTYNDLVHYVQVEKGHLKHSSTVLLLKKIDHYYQTQNLENPLADFKLKSSENRTYSSLLSEKQLQDIWWIYSKNPRLSDLQRIILSLLLFQGLSTGELDSLKVSDIDMEKAQISVPKGLLEARTLDLQGVQIQSLSDFIQDKSPEASLLNYKSKKQLSDRNRHLTIQITKELEKYTSAIPFKNLTQLRNSRISLWVNQLGVLQAQYLAGHQHLSSTYRFKSQSTSELRAGLVQAHPFF